MGCCGSSSTYGVDPETTDGAIQAVRDKHKGAVLMVAIKDQNKPGKLCLSGDVEQGLVEAILAMLQQDERNKGACVEKDEYDAMWDVVFRNTVLTSGHTIFSLAKPYFPRGKIIVQLFDTIAGFGWSMSAAPNFGGVEVRDKNGKVTSCVDWPVLVFYKDAESPYTGQHMLFAVKDSNIPGKVCAAGPVGQLEGKFTQELASYMNDVKSEKDNYDGDDYDVVWQNTSITTGMQALSFSKAYFPKGKTNIAMLNCAYSCGWRVVAAPNFGGQGDSWPCFVFRQLKDAGGAQPKLLFASIKDSNIPGKICFSGADASGINDAVCGSLTKVEGNGDVKSEKDDYDADHDEVARNVKITTGMAMMSFSVKYFPRGDSMITFLNTVATEGYQIAACPNFGGMLDSWPTFVFEQQDPMDVAFLAIKDDNIPGKIVLGGPGIAEDASLGPDLLEALQALCGSQVTQKQDDYDKTYPLAFRNTKVTTGHATFTWSKPYWPHGYVVEAILRIMLSHGWRTIGGPNFGDDGSQWPGMVFQRVR